MFGANALNLFGLAGLPQGRPHLFAFYRPAVAVNRSPPRKVCGASAPKSVRHPPRVTGAWNLSDMEILPGEEIVPMAQHLVIDGSRRAFLRAGAGLILAATLQSRGAPAQGAANRNLPIGINGSGHTG